MLVGFDGHSDSAAANCAEPGRMGTALLCYRRRGDCDVGGGRGHTGGFHQRGLAVQAGKRRGTECGGRRSFERLVQCSGQLHLNQNDLTITEIVDSVHLQQDRHSSEHAVIADLLLYFRSRRSRIRPYLSAGTGFVRMFSTADGPVQGTLTPVPLQVDATELPLRVAVGADLLFGGGWGFRYSFSETISRNPFSAALNPPGARRLANFQNLFGVVKYFGSR